MPTVHIDQPRRYRWQWWALLALALPVVPVVVAWVVLR
jgi:hypothetical protein